MEENYCVIIPFYFESRYVEHIFLKRDTEFQTEDSNYTLDNHMHMQIMNSDTKHSTIFLTVV